MAEQAQAKLDEVQTQFNRPGRRARRRRAARRVRQARPADPAAPPATATPPQGDPLAGTSAAAPSPTATPGVPPTGQGDPPRRRGRARAARRGRRRPPPSRARRRAEPRRPGRAAPVRRPRRTPAAGRDAPAPDRPAAARTATTRATRRRSSRAATRSRLTASLPEPPRRGGVRDCAPCARSKACSRPWSPRSTPTAASTRTPPSRSAATCSRNGSHGLVVCGTTGEAATLTDDEHIGMVELIVARGRRRGAIVAGTGSNDTRHAIELTERAIATGARRRAVGHAVLQQAEPPRHQAPLRGGRARGRRHAGDPLQHPRPHGVEHAARPARRAGADRRHRRPSSRPTPPSCSRSTGWRCWPATTTSGAPAWTWAAPAASASRRTSSAPRCAVCTTSPTARGDRRLAARRLRRDVHHREPGALKAALKLLGHDAGGAAAAAGRGRRGRASTSAPCWSATGCSRGARRRERHPACPPARGARRDRQEHDGRRVRGPDRRRRRRAALPDRRDDGHRPRAARLRLPARARGRHRGDRDHPRPRGPLGALPWVLRELGETSARHLRRPAHGRDGPLQARRAQAARERLEVLPTARWSRPGRSRSSCAPHALDPGRVRRRATCELGTILVTGDYKFDQTPVGGAPGGRLAPRRARPRGPAAAVRRLDERRPPGLLHRASRSSARTSSAPSQSAPGGSSSRASRRTSTACSRSSTPPRRSTARWPSSGARCART